MPVKFTHNAITSHAIEACLEFYQRFCGLAIVKDRNEGPGRVVWLAAADRDAPIFVIAESSKPRMLDGKSDPVMRHFGFELEDRAAVDALHLEMVAAGYKAEAPCYWGEVAGYLFMVRDPDGRVVEFSAEQDVSPANWDVGDSS